jgi:NAD(P)-dependent dehydrogenase (short-subunit alcohol dehydrogenase family)
MNLTGKTIVITGGASGMGEACAHIFSEKGAKVVVADRDEARGKAVAASVTAKGGVAAFIATDVTHENAIKAMVDFAVDKFGGVDGAVNGAGIAGTPANLADVTAAEWRINFEIMMLGVALCMKYEIPAMLKRGGGSIVNIASAGGLGGVPMMAPYSAAKHGVIGATKSAALEYAAAGIRVNALCPGLIDTPMFRNKITEGADYSAVVKSVPMGRFGTASEIADVALWLLSARSSFVTGQAIGVDGGLSSGAFGRPE